MVRLCKALHNRSIGLQTPGEGRSLGNLGVVYRSLGQYDKAIDYHTQALAIAREISDREGEGSILGNIGGAYYSLGQYGKAMKYYTQALKIFEEIKSPHADWARETIAELEAEKD